MEHDNGTFEGHGGIPIQYQSWLPQRPPRAAVVLVHGVLEHGGRYGNLVRPLVALGYAVHAADHRGHGRSGGRRAAVDRFDDYVSDLTEFSGTVCDRHPDVPAFLIGHSMGGLIGILHLARHQSRYRGAVLSAPSVRPPRRLSRCAVALGRLAAAFMPRLHLGDINPSRLSRNPDAVGAWRGDPLVCHDGLTLGLGRALLDAMAGADAAASCLRLPLLVLQGDADTIVDPAGARDLVSRVAARDTTVRLYPGLYHELFNEPEREIVLADVLTWLEARRAAPATGDWAAGDCVGAGNDQDA